MIDDADTERDVSRSTRARRSAPPPVVFPAPSIWAIVRFGPLPSDPPEELLPYAIRRAQDWVLTDDALAFGGTDIIQRFNEWRATWERTWVLDPMPNLIRLSSLARQLDTTDGDMARVFGRDVSDFLINGRDIELPLHRAIEIDASLTQIATLIRERDAGGYGIVDRTPNCERIGLARSWPSSGESEVIAASGDLSVVFDPATGLHLDDSRESGSVRFGPIDSVERADTIWTVSDGGSDVRLSGEEGTPLAWIVPGATAWSVRPIPEVVAWSKTFAGMSDAVEFAERIDAPIRLTAGRPIADHRAYAETT